MNPSETMISQIVVIYNNLMEYVWQAVYKKNWEKPLVTSHTGSLKGAFEASFLCVAP